jgi:hypothetical protein
MIKIKLLDFFILILLIGISTIIYWILLNNELAKIKRDTIQNTIHFEMSKKGGNAIKITSANRKKCKSVWKNAPSLSLLCRGYHKSVVEFYNVFLVGYNLFWPKEQWINSDLIVVLDDDSELDHRLGTVLANLPPYPNVYFETSPEEETFCPGNRGVGYSGQQYSNFYSDLYTDKDYIGIVDSDTFFQGPVVLENLFVNGKPRIVGYIILHFIKQSFSSLIGLFINY